ncbi:hypothetical protein PU630_07545 [Microbacterium horticulturae]|uniref:Uncharacterized protein n=1 Tax=Microbacterium horticulturae TaxID=3028316 RepID=A0ABY8C2S4_9MICO|nr:hypothetical protein [Microbacterium sp. KACC 23027]WEG10392.1 hypothetical protein PU630_07545 [Microbacterium sp. KACC 23027]
MSASKARCEYVDPPMGNAPVGSLAPAWLEKKGSLTLGRADVVGASHSQIRAPTSY